MVLTTSGMGYQTNLELTMANIAIGNLYLWLIFPLKMVIFRSFASLPEGDKETWVVS